MKCNFDKLADEVVELGQKLFLSVSKKFQFFYQILSQGLGREENLQSRWTIMTKRWVFYPCPKLMKKIFVFKKRNIFPEFVRLNTLKAVLLLNLLPWTRRRQFWKPAENFLEERWKISLAQFLKMIQKSLTQNKFFFFKVFLSTRKMQFWQTCRWKIWRGRKIFSSVSKKFIKKICLKNSTSRFPKDMQSAISTSLHKKSLPRDQN